MILNFFSSCVRVEYPSGPRIHSAHPEVPALLRRSSIVFDLLGSVMGDVLEDHPSRLVGHFLSVWDDLDRTVAYRGDSHSSEVHHVNLDCPTSQEGSALSPSGLRIIAYKELCCLGEKDRFGRGRSAFIVGEPSRWRRWPWPSHSFTLI